MPMTSPGKIKMQVTTFAAAIFPSMPPGKAQRSYAREPLIKSFDRLRTNGRLLHPFVVSLSNHTQKRLNQSCSNVWVLLAGLRSPLTMRRTAEGRRFNVLSEPSCAEGDRAIRWWQSLAINQYFRLNGCVFQVLDWLDLLDSCQHLRVLLNRP